MHLAGFDGDTYPKPVKNVSCIVEIFVLVHTSSIFVDVNIVHFSLCYIFPLRNKDFEGSEVCDLC